MQTANDRAYRHALIYANEHTDNEDIEVAILELISDLIVLADEDYSIEIAVDRDALAASLADLKWWRQREAEAYAGLRKAVSS